VKVKGKFVKNQPQTTTLLVVDDEPEIGEIIQSWLTSEGVRVITAAGSADALDILRETQIDILLSDIRMPEMDGISLFRLIEKMGGAHRTPEVLFMTASHDPRRGEALGTGAKGIIQKPFSGRQLLSWIYYSVSPQFRPAFEKQLRFPVQLPARYGLTNADFEQEGMILNVSTNGILMGTNDRIPDDGAPVYIRFRIPEKEPVFLTGKTLWKRDLRSAEWKWQFGVNVSTSQEGDLKHFRDFVRDIIAKG